MPEEFPDFKNLQMKSERLERCKELKMFTSDVFYLLKALGLIYKMPAENSIGAQKKPHFDKVCKAMVTKFKKANGLKADGVVD